MDLVIVRSESGIRIRMCVCASARSWGIKAMRSQSSLKSKCCGLMRPIMPSSGSERKSSPNASSSEGIEISSPSGRKNTLEITKSLAIKVTLTNI